MMRKQQLLLILLFILGVYVLVPRLRDVARTRTKSSDHYNRDYIVQRNFEVTSHPHNIKSTEDPEIQLIPDERKTTKKLTTTTSAPTAKKQTTKKKNLYALR